MSKGGPPSSLLVIDGSPCARHEPKNAEEKKCSKQEKKNRKGIKSPVLSIERQFLIFNIYINYLSCVDDNFSWVQGEEEEG